MQMLVRRLIGGVTVAAVLLSGYATSARASTPRSLVVSQATAFALLGRSCGGIREQAFATGFDATSGHPIGDVYLQTRCGGSGRGGGYHVTTYSAWADVTWDFAGNATSVIKRSTVPTGLSPTFVAFDSHGDEVYNTVNGVNVLPANCSVLNVTYCTYRAYLSVPTPAAPTGVTAVPSGGQFLVSWVPDPLTAGVITSSAITATPVGSTAAVVTIAAIPAATSALIGPLGPLTTYDITVTSTDAGGTSPPSGPPVEIVTPASAHPPLAPTGITAHWIGTSLGATWIAAAAGDSPVDSYQVRAKAWDADPPAPEPYLQTVDGSTLSATFTLDSTFDWAVTVRAHNAAGWGPWSAKVVLFGL